LRVSWPSGTPWRRRSPTAPSCRNAVAERTPPSREPCSRSTDPRPRRARPSSLTISTRPASAWRPLAGTSRRGGAPPPPPPAEGARHCRRVTTLLAAVPESRETLMLELTSRIARFEIGRLAGIEEGEARDLFDEARVVAERLRDRAGHAFLLTSYGRLCGLGG